MIPALLALFITQLLGEVLSRTLSLPLPGPVLGMLILLTGFALMPRLVEIVRPLAQGILGNLSLLFVPAGGGVVGHLDILGHYGLPLILALVISTVLSIAIGALTFVGVARLIGSQE